MLLACPRSHAKPMQIQSVLERTMRFEFGDLYKFIVSSGVILIALAVLTPWLFLKEPFDLFRTEAELSQLTLMAQETVSRRQKLASYIVSLLPWLSATGAVAGVCLCGFGLIGWKKNQRVLDQRAITELAISRQSLRDATPEEVEARRDTETEERMEQMEAAGEREPISAPKITSEALSTERTLMTRFHEIFSEKYHVLTEKIVDRAFIDIVLRGKEPFTKDFLVEVKYISRGFGYAWLKETALKLRIASNLYSNVENRIPNTILLVVARSEVWANPKYQVFLERFASDYPRRLGKNRIVYLTPSEIENFDSKEFQRKIGVYA